MDLYEFVQCIIGFPIGIPLCAIARNCSEWRGINLLAIARKYNSLGNTIIHKFKF